MCPPATASILSPLAYLKNSAIVNHFDEFFFRFFMKEKKRGEPLLLFFIVRKVLQCLFFCKNRTVPSRYRECQLFELENKVHI